MTLEVENELPGFGIPDLRGFVMRSRDDAGAISTDRHAIYNVVMSPEIRGVCAALASQTCAVLSPGCRNGVVAIRTDRHAHSTLKIEEGLSSFGIPHLHGCVD